MSQSKIRRLLAESTVLWRKPWTMNYEPFTSIKNPTLAHFRHFRHFSSLYFTLAHFRHFSSLYFTLVHFRHFRHFSSLFTNSPLYICREASTNQLLFMQNKPNFPKSQMNLNLYITTDYENLSDWTIGENKPNSNPIKPNLKRAKMNANDFITKDYRKKDDFTVRINKPNFVKVPKWTQTYML